MVASLALALALALSAVLGLTGSSALARASATVTGHLARSRRTSELAHLLMSVAMLVMTWTSPGTTGVTVQIVLFTGVAGYFTGVAVRRHRTQSHAVMGGCAHALMAAAMVWMLAAMPLLLPSPSPAMASRHGEHAGHIGAAALPMGTPGAAPGWAIVVTVGVCAALLATSGFWAARALRGRAAPAGARPTASTCAEPPLPGPRSDARCHVLMGLVMTAMLLAMIAGW